jgi:exodeoxyribonuclease VII small subunit
MAKSESQRKQPADQDQVPSFEESLEELQQIVEELEGGALSLADSMHRFERGVGLLRASFGLLEEAEQKIQILTGLDEDGNPVTEPFDATSTLEKNNPTKKRAKRKPKAEAAEEENGSDADEDSTSTLF